MITSRASSAALQRSTRRAAVRPRTALVCNASRSSQTPLHQSLLSAASATLLSAALTLAPAPLALAEEFKTIADVVRADFIFVDGNKDGVVSQEELKELSKQLADEQDMPTADPTQLEFTYKLFDLNQDGKLTTEEVLRSIALDGAVDDDAVDESVFEVFDRNKDQKVDRGEWVAALGDFGPNGDGFKQYVFTRVDHLTESQGKLDINEFATALVVVRTAALGY